jgi:hypothetical protein
MDSVESMKLSKIIKNKKAITPLMIGIIVAASVLAVFVVVMAATIPLYTRDLEMSVKANSIRGNSTDLTQLNFRIICDYDVGILTDVEILKDEGEPLLTYVAHYNGSNMEFFKSQELPMSLNFTKELGYNALPPEGTDGGYFIFGRYFEYVLRITYENEDGSISATKDYDFTYDY